MMERPYAIISLDALRLLIRAASKSRSNAAWVKLYPHLAAFSRKGDDLPEWEQTRLSEWLTASHAGVALGDVRAVQMGLAQIDGITGNRQTTRRALHALIDNGLLSLAVPGCKGHASLYAFEPVGFEVTDTHENVTQKEVTDKLGTVTQSSSYGVTFGGEWGHGSAEMGSRFCEKPQENLSYQLPINDLSKGADDAAARGAASSPLCPTCGNPTELTNSHKGGKRLYRCRNCWEEVWKAVS